LKFRVVRHGRGDLPSLHTRLQSALALLERAATIRISEVCNDLECDCVIAMPGVSRSPLVVSSSTHTVEFSVICEKLGMCPSGYGQCSVTCSFKV
jgi:hypothetical protein